MVAREIVKRFGDRIETRFSSRSRRSLIAWMGLLPALAILVLYRLIPLLWNFYLSFHDMKYTGETTFVGLENYIHILEDAVFWTSLFNTILFLAAVPIAVTIALGLALLLNKKFIGNNLFRSMFFLPYVTMMVAIAVIWVYMFKTRGGVLNYIFLQIGLIQNPIPWLSDPTWARISIMIVQIWKTVGFYLVIILAGLQSIPSQVYEVAEIDGASRYQRFRYVTLPLLKPTLGLCAILGLVVSFELFDLVQVLTHGGPGHSTEILITWIYKQAFAYGNFGYSAVLTIILFVLLAGVSLIGLSIESEEYY